MRFASLNCRMISPDRTGVNPTFVLLGGEFGEATHQVTLYRTKCLHANRWPDLWSRSDIRLAIKDRVNPAALRSFLLYGQSARYEGFQRLNAVVVHCTGRF